MRKVHCFMTKKWRYWVIGIVSFLMLAGVVCLFCVNRADGLQDALTNPLKLANVYYVTQIVTGMAVIIGGVIGVWQYTLTARAERVKLNVDQIQKAIDLAEYYKDNILRNFSIISYVYEGSGLLKVIEKMPKDKLEHFDEQELRDILGQEAMDRIREITASKEFIETVVSADVIYGLNLDWEKRVRLTFDDTKRTVETSLEVRSVAQKFMGTIVQDTLNDMEFFAMHFTHRTADESVVYQSLHQTFLEIVYALYYDISSINRAGCSKYYTNIIELYEVWHGRAIDDEEQKNKVRRYKQKGSSAGEIGD